MAKYEIMLVISGTLDEAQAKTLASDVAKPIKDCKPQIIEYGLQQLAYKIKNQSTGHRVQYNFECESPASILEFRRLCTINKNILRSLIINLEKDYGFKASVNPKKIAANKKTAEISAIRKAEFEKIRLAREAMRQEGGEGASFERKEGRGEYKPRSGEYKPRTARPGTAGNKTDKPAIRRTIKPATKPNDKE